MRYSTKANHREPVSQPLAKQMATQQQQQQHNTNKPLSFMAKLIAVAIKEAKQKKK